MSFKKINTKSRRGLDMNTLSVTKTNTQYSFNSPTIVIGHHYDFEVGDDDDKGIVRIIETPSGTFKAQKANANSNYGSIRINQDYVSFIERKQYQIEKEDNIITFMFDEVK